MPQDALLLFPSSLAVTHERVKLLLLPRKSLCWADAPASPSLDPAARRWRISPRLRSCDARAAAATRPSRRRSTVSREWPERHQHGLLLQRRRHLVDDDDEYREGYSTPSVTSNASGNAGAPATKSENLSIQT